ncbi:hypothetical protein MRX96_007273 [Rhipicephalus microplus]
MRRLCRRFLDSGRCYWASVIRGLGVGAFRRHRKPSIVFGRSPFPTVALGVPLKVADPSDVYMGDYKGYPVSTFLQWQNSGDARTMPNHCLFFEQLLGFFHGFCDGTASSFMVPFLRQRNLSIECLRTAPSLVSVMAMACSAAFRTACHVLNY